MRERVAFARADAAPDPDAVFALMGIRRAAAVTDRHRALVEDALADFARTVAAEAVTHDVERAEFEAVYRGDGLNDDSTPLAAVYPRADRLVLFAATIGEPVCRRIADLFAANDPVRGFVLDAVASVAADTLANRLCARVSAATTDAARRAVLAYSPGYCGWHVSGQRALFERLQPDEIGIRLNESCLMTPIKSVSGVLVAGGPGVHRFRPAFACCDACVTRPCVPRMASVRSAR